jgi:hypothetical protein
MMLMAITLAVLFIGLGDFWLEYIDPRLLFVLVFSIMATSSLPESGKN